MSDPSPEIVQLVAQWVRYAEEDLRNATYTLTMPENCPYSTVCFHAQQAVEKYNKALLVSRSIHFPRIHDIDELSRCLPSEIHFPLSAEQRQTLTDYAIVSRYPGEWEPLDRTEADEAIAMARQIRALIRKHLPDESLTLPLC